MALLVYSNLIQKAEAQIASATRVFVNLDKSMVPCNQELQYMLEDEMIELNLMKTLWSNVTSDTRMTPMLKVSSNLGTTSNPQYQVNIKGLMNNTYLSDIDSMAGIATWMKYPISLHDLTKLNFTLQWSSVLCNLNYNTLINCSPQGGFALVFQQESTKALGEYKNNLGQGLGYDGLSGIFAIEFDTQAVIHESIDGFNQLRINMQIRNSNIKLLSSSQSSTFKTNSNPMNFASFNLSGFSSQIQVQFGIITNQINEQIMIVLDMNGMRQLEVKTTFSELGLDPTRTYYVGFTSAQNMNKLSPTASLDITNFRIFKGKPKYVDGQVSYIGDSVGPKGNQSNLEIRSSFYDLCYQKTTLPVYPTVAESDWLNGLETEPHIIPFYTYKDTMIVGSIINNINKPEFYSPGSLTISSDVKYSVSLPTGVTTNVRMGFYYYKDLIMNITAIDYYKRTNSNYTFLVIEDSDLITSTLNTKGYANNLYQFTVDYYDGQLNPVIVDFSLLQLTVTSDYIRLNNTVYSNLVSLSCYGVATSSSTTSSSSSSSSNAVISSSLSSSYTCSFTPNVNGTYYINSPYLPSARAFKLDIGQADQVTEILSSEYSQAVLLGNFSINAGSTVEVYIDLRNNLNATYVPASTDNCVFTNSYYYLNNIKYSFLFYDQYPYLRTQINDAGTANFKISISCTRQSFDLQCYRCQKVILPITSYLYYLMTIPAYPSSFDTPLATNIMLKQSTSFVIDVTFYDRFDNIVPSELDTATFNSFSAQFMYGKSKNFTFLKVQMPGKLYLFLNASDNYVATQLTARTNIYYLSIQSPGSSLCFSTQTETRRVFYVSPDKSAPMDIVGDGDINKIDQTMTSVYWDNIVNAGEVGKIQFVLKNTNNLQMGTWVALNDTTQFSPKIQDSTGKTVTGSDCKMQFANGIYEGEYFGFFICNSGPKFYQIVITVNGSTFQMPQAVFIRPGNATQSNLASLFPTSSVLTLGNTGLNITVRLADMNNNSYDTNLINKNQIQLGLITYSLMQLSTGIVQIFDMLPMVNTANGQYRIHVNNVPVGQYRLFINLPIPLSFDFTFNSSSTKLSPKYSFAYLDNPTQNFLNNQVILRFYARNIHNQSLTDLSLLPTLLSQIQVYLWCSNGAITYFNSSTTFTSTDGVYYNFTSNDKITSNGLYTIIVFFPDSRTYLNVRDGVFQIFDNYDPLASELYMVKGMDQREYRMAPFNMTAQLTNQYNATLYDPRFDGTLRFKLYLRTSANNELVSNPKNSASLAFTGAYITTAQYVGTNFTIGQNLTNINFKIVNFTGTFMIVPNDTTDQDKIEQLIEGYYFIYLTGNNFGNKYSIYWLFSLFNSDAGQQNSAASFTLLAPRFVNITAGEPFTFLATAMGGTPSLTTLSITSNSSPNDLSVEFESTARLIPTAGNHFYVQVYCVKAGTYYLQMTATYQKGTVTNPPKEVVIQVNPAHFYQLSLLNNASLIAKTSYTIGTKISFNFTFLDRWGNQVFIYERNRPAIQEIIDQMQFVHFSSKPYEVQVLPIYKDQIYQCTFTTYYAGILSLIPGVFNYTQTQTVQSAMLNVTFISNSTALPSPKFTYAAIRSPQNILLAGSNLLVDIYLMDDYGNQITGAQNRYNYLVNIIPDNICNVTTQIMNFLLQFTSVLTFQQTITVACTYDIKVFFFSSDVGQIDIPCINCYSIILPNAEDPTRVYFLDARDVLVSTVNKGTIYMTKQDINPKLIMTFRDQYENLITNPQLSLNYTYQFHLVQNANENILFTASWQTYKSFHYLMFCTTETVNQTCFSTQTTGQNARLRVQQLKGTTVVSKQFINVFFVDNYAAIYNSDDLNSISNPYSYMRILNYDAMPTVGYELSILPDQCQGGDQYPLIGRIELKTSQGFRRNDTFTVIGPSITLTLDGIDPARYIFSAYSGSTTGMVLFSLFFKDDYFTDRKQAIARVFINGVEYTNTKINIQCRRRQQNYQKYVVASNGSLIQTFESQTLQAGSTLTFKVIAADPQWMSISQFRPYDDKIFFNYSITNQNIEKYDFTQIQYDYFNNLVIYQIAFTLAGKVIMGGSQISSLSNFSLTITPGPISYKYSTASALLFKTRAGDNSSVLINPVDEYGNQITLSNNTQLELTNFNAVVQVYIARKQFYTNEVWNQVQCFDIVNGQVRCSTVLTVKGIYKYRVMINGYTAQCQNCYVRVLPSGKYNYNMTVLTDLSQNYYSNQALAFSKFNVQTRLQGIFYKFFVSDEYQNIYINEDYIQIDNITAKITYNGADQPLNISKILAAKTGAGTQVYSCTIYSSSLATFPAISESIYKVQVIFTTLKVASTAIFTNFIKANRTSTTYPQVQSTQILKLNFRQTTYFQQIAGRYSAIQFGVYDDNQFLQNISSNQQYNFQVAVRFNSTTFVGDYMLGPYRNIYTRLLRIDLVNQTDIINQLFTQQYSVTVNILNPTVTVTQVQFTTYAFANQLVNISYVNNNTEFSAKDAWNNDIDFPYDPTFFLRVIQLRTNLNQQPPFWVAKYNYTMNYIKRRGELAIKFDPQTENLTQYQIIDSVLFTKSLFNPFSAYANQGILDISKCYFEIAPISQVLTAGEYVQVKLSLLDVQYQKINITNNLSALGNISVHLVFSGQKQHQKINFTSNGVKLSTTDMSQWYILNFQINLTGMHYIYVSYYNQSIPSKYGSHYLNWLFVQNNLDTGNSSQPDMQWTFSVQSLQRNRIQDISQTNGTEYVNLQETQPVFFVARICDRFGNAFDDTGIYDLYNVFELALQSRIANFGRTMSISTLIIYNVILISVNNQQQRDVFSSYLPSYYPIQNNANYNSMNSFRVEIYSPGVSQSLKQRNIYLVISTDFPIDDYMSQNQTANQLLMSTSNGGGVPVQSDSFIGGQVQLRMGTKALMSVRVLNSDGRTYVTEQIQNFTLNITNTTSQILQNTTNPKNITNYTVQVPITNVTIQVMPYSNQGFYRIYFLSNTSLYQQAALNTQFTIKTAYLQNNPPLTYPSKLWVFPPIPPNYLNPINNLTFLPTKQTQFKSATKVQFNLTLKYNNFTYINDYQSALNIQIYRSSTLEQVTGQLINSSVYTISVNLEGPSDNQFRIYYLNPSNGALYPLTTPDVIYFQIQSSDNTLQMSLQNDDKGYLYPKLGQLPYYAEMETLITPYNRLQRHFQLKASFDINNVKIVIIPNILQSIYTIGNDFTASILVVDNQTSRCLLPTDYNVNTDLLVQIYSYDPLTGALGRVSIDVASITLVKNVVSLSTSYCTYYSNAVLETSSQLSTPGNYTLIATFMGKVTANITFQALVSGIDYSQTTIGWYQQTSLSDELIAEFNAYEEFNYLVYFFDALGNYVSDRQSFVQITLNFDGQKLVENTNYQYISRYDDRFKGYLITIQFFKAGSFKPEYYFNLQRAENIEVTNGPIIFVVHEPQCINVEILSTAGVSLSIGQLFTFSFQCYDINGNMITQPIHSVQTQALFQNLNMNNQQEFGQVDALSNGIYKVTHKFYSQGVYTLKVYFNQLLIYSDPTTQYTIGSEICKDIQGNIMFKCPNNPSVCAYSYYECNYINTTACPLSTQPFKCGNGQCVSSMSTQCCRLGDINFVDYLWCPNSNQCFNTSQATCPTINTTKPLFCLSLSKYVTHQYECCGDLTYNVSVSKVVNGSTQISVQTKSMVTCSNENKCVPQDNAQFCFVPFKRNCSEIFGIDYPYQCPNDGKCKRTSLDCPSPRVCPIGYTMCPDGSCIQGTNKFSQCNPLQNCTRMSPDQVTTVEFIRCADGSCASQYEQCPSLISCQTSGQVVCPDGSCKNSAFECIQPLECTTDKPYKCPGQPNVCASSRNECPIPASLSCGTTQSLCADGDCSDQCLPSSQYQVYTSSSAAASQSLMNLCIAQKMIQCPNLECRNSYFECSDSLYCPNPINYTYAASSVICPGAQICALDQTLCSYSQCSSILNDQFLPSNNSYDQITQTEIQLRTCYDGRCHYSNRMKQNVCMTPFSCSFSYFKSGGFGEFCVSSTNVSLQLVQTSLFNSDHKCSKDKFKCVTGECRNSIDDCPTQITCPAQLPIQCRDGQCVKSKTQCAGVDAIIQQNLINCANDGFLLCTSDLITCTTSLSQCPTRSTCPIGFIKCFDESCIDPETDSCPQVVQYSQQIVVSTCEDQFANPYHCFADGSCRAALEDCPTQVVCPVNRPVKCMDGSCRSSQQECPVNLNCPNGTRFCAGEGTCVKITKQCGTPETCSAVSPFKCEDGSCVSDITLCLYESFSVSNQTLQCYTDRETYVCQSNKQCVKDPSYCKSSSACSGTALVKAQESNLCYSSRAAFSSYLVIEQGQDQCEINNMLTCANGTCSSKLCPEWLQCPQDKTPIKCSNGQCVSNQQLCPSPATGCPSYKPIRCNYTGVCVSDQSQCYTSAYPDDNSNLNMAQAYCKANFQLSTPCYIDGSCQASSSDCSKVQNNTCLSLYPNNSTLSAKCLIPQCPLSLPYKCNNGLCVQSSEDCPLYSYSIQDLAYCASISNITGLNQAIPCGNGQCVTYSTECLPLYDCSLNTQNGLMYRCNDGTCRAKPSDCPIKQTVCAPHVPFMCLNGMCAATYSDCLRSDNGCPNSAPYKCPYDGHCLASSSLCISPYNQMAQMFIYPTYIPQISPTPLIAYYGITRNTCQKNGQFVCRIRGKVPYCLDNLKDCIDPITGCSVIAPIRCGPMCVSSPWQCLATNSSCSSIGASICTTSQKCVASSSNPLVYNASLQSGAQATCDTMNGCPETSPFQCPNINKKSCSILPYTSFPQFYNQSCGTFERSTALQVLTNIFNDCFSQDTPYSCADGSCVSDINLCPTCIYYCTYFRRCVKSQADCDYLQMISTTTTYSNLLTTMQQQCPLSMPNRCILSGKCVSSSIDCALADFVSQSSQYNQTNHGNLFDDSCPLQAPIKCYNGKCVPYYDNCLINADNNVDLSVPYAFNNPVKWGNQTLLYNSSCQVYCYDGSCRDRIENCPLIHGCYDLSRPYRCSNGICTKDSSQCLTMLQTQFDSTITDLTQLGNCTQGPNPWQKYQRCEDGVCRPLLYNSANKTYTSSCLPYMGCPIGTPYHCSTGECVKDESSCAGSSRCSTNLPFRCKNFDCVEDMSDCERPYSTFSALQLDVTIDPYEKQDIIFSYSNSGEVLGKLEYISNTLNYIGNISALQSMLLTQTRVQVYPVPDSILDQVLNIIPKTRIQYIQAYFPLDGNTTLPSCYTLMSPAIKIELSNPLQLPNNQDYAYLYFKIDQNSMPQVLNLDQDMCLGFVIYQTGILDGTASWQCQSREMNRTSDGFLKFKINQLGIYALIINPNPDVQSEDECGFICQNHQMLLILELVLVGALAFIIYALCLCCHTKEPLQKQKKQKDSFIRGSNSFVGRMSGAFYPNNQNSYLSPAPGAINNTTYNQTPEQFYNSDGQVQELDVDQLKEHLENLDPNDPPLLPGQYVMLLAQQHDTQSRQIDVLKSQLQEFQSREMDNLALIKAIFEKNKILHAQIQLKQELEGKDSLNNTKKTGRSKRPRKIKEDPSIMSEYNNIDAYLAQSMMGSRYQQHPQMVAPLLDAQASKATFQEFPGGHNMSILNQVNANDNSLMSIPVQNYHNQGKMLVSESTRELIYKNYQSTTQLEEADLHDKMSNMLIKDDNQQRQSIDQDTTDNMQEYNRRLGELADEIQQLEKIEEEKDEEQTSLIRKNKNQRKRPDEDSLANRRMTRRSKSRSKSRNKGDADSLSNLMKEGTLSRQADVRDSIKEENPLYKTFNTIFPNKRKGQGGVIDTKGYNMFLGNESITGNVSGNIIKLNQVEPDMQKRYEEYVNSKDDNDSEDENAIEEASFQRLKEIEQLMKNDQSKKKNRKDKNTKK